MGGDTPHPAVGLLVAVTLPTEISHQNLKSLSVMGD